MSVSLSIIIPAYNAEKYLPECLDSIVRQSVFDKMQVVVVDDGSTDGTPEICDAYAKKYDNITVIHQKNAGVSAARNAGLEAAEGEYITFADADDFLLDGVSQKLLDGIINSSAQLVFCDLEIRRGNKMEKIIFPFESGKVMEGESGRKAIASFMLRDASQNTLCNKIMRADIIRDNSIRLTPGRKQGEDREFVLEYLAHCERIVYINFVGYAYRYVKNSAVQKARDTIVDEIFEQYDSDIGQYNRLGFSDEEFKRGKALFICSQIVGAMCASVGKMTRKACEKTLASMAENERLKMFLKENSEAIKNETGKFNAGLLEMLSRGDTKGIIRNIKTLNFKAKILSVIGR